VAILGKPHRRADGDAGFAIGGETQVGSLEKFCGYHGGLSGR